MSLSQDDIRIIINHSSDIIFSNEGNYDSVTKNDNGAMSIGKMQWHANRALSLMKSICNLDNTTSKSILGESLYNEIISASNSDWNNRIATGKEAYAISLLLVTDNGKKVQDDLAINDIFIYVSKGISYGLNDFGSLIYFADGVNQYGVNSELWKNISTKALNEGGTVHAMYNATKSLTDKYLTRREKVYNKILSLNLDNKVNDKSKSDKPSDWATESWDYAKSHKWVAEYRCQDQATREEVVAILYNALKDVNLLK